VIGGIYQDMLKTHHFACAENVGAAGAAAQIITVSLDRRVRQSAYIFGLVGRECRPRMACLPVITLIDIGGESREGWQQASYAALKAEGGSFTFSSPVLQKHKFSMSRQVVE
jgi:hypothetical protein